jgi:hypothetical protein
MAIGAVNIANVNWVLPNPLTDVWVRLGVLMHANPNSENALVSFSDNAGSLQGRVTWTTSDSLLRAYRSTVFLLGTSALQMSADQWHTLEVRWQMTSLTVGTVEVWLDGAQTLNLVGVDNTQTSALNIGNVLVGTGAAMLSGGPYYAFDDLAINDTNGTVNNGRPGDGRVVLLSPSGAGSSTQLLRGGTDSGANWSQVDDVPMSMTDFVYDATAGHRDLYTLQDVPSAASGWSVNTVEALAYAQTSDVGSMSVAPTLKTGATTAEGAAQALAISPQYFRQQYQTNPDTTAGWTVADLNALEAGVTVH